MSQNQKVKRELKALLIDNNETLPTLSSEEGNNIAERLKQRRRGKSINQIEIKRTELENPFVPKKSRRGAKRKRNEFIERLEEKEPQFMQQEQEVITEESDPVWEPWDEITPTRHIRRLKNNVVSVVIEPKDVGETSTREKRRRVQNSKETQEDKKELDAVASLLAMANGKKAPQMMTPGRTAENLATKVSLRTPEPVLRSLASSFDNAPHQIKRGPKMVDYEIADLATFAGLSQPVLVNEQGALAMSDKFFEDNATQQKRSRTKKMPAEMSSSLNVKAFSSFTEMKHAKEIDHHITRHFNKWEIELNSNINVLLYGLGSKEHIIETYQAFESKNENVIWIHFDGSGDLTTMNDAYLMLLDRTLGPNNIFKNHTLIGKALAIRDFYNDSFYNDIIPEAKFKIIVSIIFILSFYYEMNNKFLLKLGS
ncbi:hypothetical protein C1645_188825 [Glomus cerebriforme]|uniref:Origin recognition complex subunit 2 n=1 Tax=Glomus cerebriforme TaxID=658196 RepID=A0A397STW3_9GLOM|nr:hypothetical protein C1645_188825 [Glomus cerebriforme]